MLRDARASHVMAPTTDMLKTWVGRALLQAMAARGRPVSGCRPATLRSGLPGADCVLVDASLSRAVVLARWVHETDAAVQEVLVVAPAERARAQRSLLFAPGTRRGLARRARRGHARAGGRAAAVTRQRRRYQITRRRMEDQLPAADPQRTPRALISDAYLAALLQVLPDPVLSIDEGDRVLTWNPAAERLFGCTATRRRGGRCWTCWRRRPARAGARAGRGGARGAAPRDPLPPDGPASPAWPRCDPAGGGRRLPRPVGRGARHHRDAPQPGGAGVAGRAARQAQARRAAWRAERRALQDALGRPRAASTPP
jgi:PAS domain-containing protein